eukprot:3308263-Pleurochrysis_carterae.AAC.1
MPDRLAPSLYRVRALCPLITLRLLRSGEFAVVNQHLLKDLMSQGLWTEEIRNQIIAHGGSVQARARARVTPGAAAVECVRHEDTGAAHTACPDSCRSALASKRTFEAHVLWLAGRNVLSRL